MRAFSFIGQWMSPVRRISCQEVEKRRLRYRVRINSPRPNRTIPLDPLHRMPLGASCQLPIGCIGRQRQRPQTGYLTRPYSVRITAEGHGRLNNGKDSAIRAGHSALVGRPSVCGAIAFLGLSADSTGAHTNRPDRFLLYLLPVVYPHHKDRRWTQLGAHYLSNPHSRWLTAKLAYCACGLQG